jgi:hypothetical protein
MAEIEGNSSFEPGPRFAMIRLAKTSRDHHGAATPSDCEYCDDKDLPPRAADAHLHLRVHVLRRLRRA